MENLTLGDLLGGVGDYVQGGNIKYIDSFIVIRIFKIGICTLVPLYPEHEVRMQNLQPDIDLRFQIQSLHPAYETNLRWLVYSEKQPGL